MTTDQMSQFNSKDGISAAELFVKGLGLAYSDFTILDTMLTDIDRDQISLKTELGMGITLETPFIASPMDTVVRPEMDIHAALNGGIACEHYNYKKPDGTPDLDQQEKNVADVKRWENGFIEHPVVVSPSMTIGQVIERGIEHKVGDDPLDTFPVTARGTPHGTVVGLLRKQDYSRVDHLNAKVSERMLPLEKLIYGQWPITLEEANKRLWDQHLLYLPILDRGGRLKYLVTRSDIDKNEEYPLATKDDKKRLRVLFAVETRPEYAYERMERCFGAGADGVVIDTSQGFTGYEIEMIRYIRGKYPTKLCIGGNFSTKVAADALTEEGMHIGRDGQGSGSICTTAGAIGISRAGATGVYWAPGHVADGGIRLVGDFFKAIALGAKACMLGNMLAGTKESPGEIEIDPQSGLPMKVYRGMGSKEANVGGIRGYSRLPQGESGHVKYLGSMDDWIPLIRDGLLSAMHVQNCMTIPELQERVRSGEIRFERLAPGAMRETGIHDLYK